MAAEGAGAPVAAIDCGTNSTRLLVATAEGVTIERHMRITRLGEGVDATHKLSPEAIERTVAVLADYRARLEALGVGRGRLVTTSAARDAANAEEFLGAAATTTGLAPEILSGDEEARLSFVGATASLPDTPPAPVDGRELVVDIGGGSTELAAGRPGADAGELAAVSIDVGCVRLTERFLHHDPPLAAELAAARRAVDALLSPARVALGPLAAGGRMFGLAGTVSTLVSLQLALVEYDRDRIHHGVLQRAEVVRWLGLLATEDRRRRLERPGMDPGRADVIVGGVLVLDAAMAAFERTSCVESESDILDGLVASVLAGAGGPVGG